MGERLRVDPSGFSATSPKTGEEYIKAIVSLYSGDEQRSCGEGHVTR